jgi:hypothetical protein
MTRMLPNKTTTLCLCADSDDAGRLFRSDPGHHSDMMPVSLSLIADF